MNKALIIQDIDQLLQRIADRREKMREHTNKIPAIELDLMMKHISDLYEAVNTLRKIKEEPIATGVSTDIIVDQQLFREEKGAEHANISWDEKENESIEFPAIQNEVIANENVAEISNIQIEDKRAEIFKESHSTEQLKPVSREAVVKQNVKVTAELFDEVSTVAQSYTVKATLHDKMSGGKTERSVATHLQSKPLTDLKKSIGINEKFVFVRDLFEGNQQLYNQSIDRLNKFSAYEEAHRHLFEELATQMNWNLESKVFNDLGELIRRRFNG